MRIHQLLLGFTLLAYCGQMTGQVRLKKTFPAPKNGNTYVIAHRGAHNGIPENSLAAYQKAIDLGCDFIEIDVRKTRDGRMVSVHNSTIDAYVNGAIGRVTDFTLAELKELDIGERVGPEWKNTRIPTIEEILQLCRGQIGIYLDLKEDLVDELVEIITKYEMEGDIVWYIPASYMDAIKDLKSLCPQCVPMPDPGPAENIAEVINQVQPPVIATDMGELSEEYIKIAHENNAMVFVDEDNGNEVEWSKILDWGTDGIQTDKPQDLIRFLSEREKKITNEKVNKKIIQAELKEVSVIEHAKLEIAGQGEDQIQVLTVWGTPYEMGKAHGTLLKKEIGHLQNKMKAMLSAGGQSVELLDARYEQSKPYIPDYFIEEMKGLADGSGLSLQNIIRINLIGEAAEFHCSLFGAWGKATAKDGHLYQLRSLDYETSMNIQKHPIIVIYVPDEGDIFANIGYAGVIGSFSGINKERLAISEIGDDRSTDEITYEGIPFTFLLRDVLQFDKSLDEATERIKTAKRTTRLLYGVGDGKFGQLRGFRTSSTSCTIYSPDNLEPLTSAHKRISDVVYWGMTWDHPKYDGPLHDKLIEHYGKIDAEVTINDIVPSVKTGNLQTVVYDLTEMKIWVANARADHESGSLPAFARQFVEFDMKAIFYKAISFREQDSINKLGLSKFTK